MDMSVQEARRVLGLQGAYTRDDMNAAYRQLSKENHPDTVFAEGGNMNVAVSTMARINEARSVLAYHLDSMSELSVKGDVFYDEEADFSNGLLHDLADRADKLRHGIITSSDGQVGNIEYVWGHDRLIKELKTRVEELIEELNYVSSPSKQAKMLVDIHTTSARAKFFEMLDADEYPKAAGDIAEWTFSEIGHVASNMIAGKDAFYLGAGYVSATKIRNGNSKKFNVSLPTYNEMVIASFRIALANVVASSEEREKAWHLVAHAVEDSRDELRNRHR